MNMKLKVSHVSKTFVLHHQNEMTLPVLSDAGFSVSAGECVVLNGQSGSGKSTLLRALYANYLVDEGTIEVLHQGQWVDLASATPREIIHVRKHTIGWVSQFLRVIPRISTLEVVMQPMLEMGGCAEEAQAKATALLTRLNVPPHLWHLAPATFSGGEQQRVNIARGFIVDYPVLLLDEPTASLDVANRAVVVSLIQEAKARGAAIVGIFHDASVREAVADHLYDVTQHPDNAARTPSCSPESKTATVSFSPKSNPGSQPLHRHQKRQDAMVITNVNLVLKDEVVYGSVEIRDGVMTSLSDTVSQRPGAYDGENGFLIPGLIELHTDNLEQHFTPRPKVNWPALPAMKAHDTQVIGSGITTVLDAIALGDDRDGIRQEHLDQFIQTVAESQRRGLTRAEHRLHLRCELPNPETLAQFERYSRLPEVQLVSVMDHAPGQRQFVDLEKYRTYYQGKYKLSEEQMRACEEKQIALSQRWSKPNREAICQLCREMNIPLASHDDATIEHVMESKALGLVIAEFPTTVEAAEKSHQLGLKVMMGAPNVVRGGSHSGNVAAHHLASLGVMDILSSDYYPASLLDAVFRLADDERNQMDMVQAVRLATLNPAQALGLDDRGQIAEGKRGDLVLVQRMNDHLAVERVWRQGKKVF